MSLQVIEGTWEEIERYKADLIGRQLRVTIKPDKTARRKPSVPAKNLQVVAQARVLIGFGAFKDALPSSEEYTSEKRAEIEREERHF
jgi:hypothetical protein